MKPIDCSYTLSFNNFFFLISSRDLILPFVSLYLIILSIDVLVSPEIYFNIEGDAVLILTPTLFTHFVTVKSKDSLSFFWDTSCWYWPTPIDLGSILTSSLSGSWSLLAIDIALLFSTVKSGNSCIARGLAEYTLAPASETMAYLQLFSSFNVSLTSFSLSLDAVPFPIAIISTLYFFIKSFNIDFDSSHLLCGSWGYITDIFKTFEVGSTIANLHPVLKAGSKPNTVFSFIGAINNKFSKLPLNTSIDASSLWSVNSFRISRSIEGFINLL